MRIIILIILFMSLLNADANDDLLFSHQWNMHASGQELLRDLNDLNSEAIVADGETNWGYQWFQKNRQHLIKKDVVVAVLDGGVDSEHPDLVGQVLPGINFATDNGEPSKNTEDETGHGTHVAGIIAAKQNGSGIQALGEFIKILPIKIFHPQEGRYKKVPLSTRITQAIEYAIEQNVDVINLSLGWPKVMHTQKLQAALEKALAQNILIVAASGNSTNHAKIYPCVVAGVVCVGSIDPLREISRFSNYGHSVDVVTPGEMIVSTYPTYLTPLKFSVPGFERMSGTSQAAPLVSAMLGVLKAVYPNASANELKYKLFASADRKGKSLYGLPNLKKALTQSTPIVALELKHIPYIILDENFQFKLEIPFTSNFSEATTLTVDSDLLFLEKKTFQIKSKGTIELRGFYFGKQTKADITIVIEQTKQKVTLSLDLFKSITQYAEEIKVTSQKPRALLIKNNVKLISKLKIVPRLNHSAGSELFYFYDTQENKLILYKKVNSTLTEYEQIKLSNGCRLLRFYEYNLDGENFTDYMLENFCGNKETGEYLNFRFLNQQMQDIQSSVKFLPEVTLINFKNVIFKQFNGKMHIFFAQNAKLPQASTNPDPWQTQDNTGQVRLFELVENEGQFLTKVINDFRFNAEIQLNDYQILNVDYQFEHINIFVRYGDAWNPHYEIWDINYNGKLLKRVILDFNGLIPQPQIQKNAQHYIFEKFYHPYSAKIDFYNPQTQSLSASVDVKTPLTNPMFGSLGHFQSEHEFSSLIKSYLYIHFLTSKDGVMSEHKIPYERLDFTGQKDLQEQLLFLESSQSDTGIAKLLIDGTNIGLESLKIFNFANNGHFEQLNFHIPSKCASIGLSSNFEQTWMNFLCAKDKGLIVLTKEI